MTQSRSARIPGSLKSALLTGRMIPFVGAGLSRAAGAPDWRGLLMGLLNHCHVEAIHVEEEDEVRQLISRGGPDLLVAAEHLRLTLREKMDEYVRNTFSRLDVQPVHHALAALNPPGIITANYDDLIERAYRESFPTELTVVTPQDDYSLARLDEIEPWILKLHGTCNNPSNVVIGWSDYERLGLNLAMSESLSRVLQQHTLLFVGFSLEDPDITEALSQLRLSFKGTGRRHYALLEDTGLGRVREKFLQDKYNVQAIRYQKSSAEHPEVLSFLKALSNALHAVQRELEKLVLLVSRPGYWLSGETETLLLVTNSNPQWAIQMASSAGDATEQRAYLLPSLAVSSAADPDVLRRSVASLLGTPSDGLKVRLDPDMYESRKFNPAIKETTNYRFQFAMVELKDAPPHLEDSDVRLGHWQYEWLPMISLRAHPATMELNSDVVLEISRRYGSHLEKLPASIESALRVDVDPYEYRAETYRSLPWVSDEKLLRRIVQIATEDPIEGIVDLGCGPAHLATFAVAKTGVKYVGFDKSPQMIIQAKEGLPSKGARVERLDFVQEQPGERFDGWCFVIKNTLHLVPSFRDVIKRLPHNFGAPASMVIVETVSPSASCLVWIQTLFGLFGMTYKSNWFIKGQIPFQLELLGGSIESVEYHEQFINVTRWLSSFRLPSDRQSEVRAFIDAMPPEVREGMKYSKRQRSERLLRLQEVVRAKFD